METKNLPVLRSIPPKVRILLRRIEKWRSTRTHGTRMPEELWRSSASLAREHGLSRVARLLRLDYYTLKECLNSLERETNKGSGPKPSFVELPPLSPAPVSECIVELEHPRGCRMRIQVKGTPTPDVAMLCQTFWIQKL